MGNRIELTAALIAQGDQLRLILRAVFLLQGNEGIKAGGLLLQSLGIAVEVLRVGGHAAVQILQLLQNRTQSLGILGSRCKLISDLAHPLLALLQPAQDARFVGIEVVAQGGEELTDAVGILQHHEFGLQLGLFA